jgi:hypothetical protein
VFVRLTVSRDEQERRLGEASRKEFDKMRSVELLRKLRDGFESCEANMPSPNLIIDTTQLPPRDAALTIAREFGLSMRS